MKASKTRYFIELDGTLLLEAHPGPRDAAFRAALEHAHGHSGLRVIVVEGDDPLSDTARRTFYRYDPRERRWALEGE